MMPSPVRRRITGSDAIRSAAIYWLASSGARLSLGVSTTVVIFSFVIGFVIGGGAALAGGRIDELVVRAVDIVMAFPRFLLAIALAAILGPGLVDLIIALTAIGWTGYARLVRGEILVLRESEYAFASRTLGA